MSVGQSGADLPTPMGAASSAGVTYTSVDDAYFKARKLKRYARVWSLWALGVGAVTLAFRLTDPVFGTASSASRSTMP